MNSLLKENESRLEAGATKKADRLGGATRYRGYLPHREGKHPIYFVTFRLAESLPRDLVSQLRRQRESAKKMTPAVEAVTGRARVRELRRLLRTAERYLD